MAFPVTIFSTMHDLPIANSQLQWIMLGISGVLFTMVLAILGTLWRLRGPVNSLIQTFLESGMGQIAIASGVRDYMTRPEGIVFMEGVINGKVRREIMEHDRNGAAHYDKFSLYAKRQELNDAISSVRELCKDGNVLSQAARQDIIKALEAINDTIDRGWEARTKKA
jgi:hypothetical protein